MFIAGTAARLDEGKDHPLIITVAAMSEESSPSIRRRNTMLLLSVFVGPGIGSVTFLVLNALAGAALGKSGAASMVSCGPLVLIGGYMLGVVPGLLSGIAMIVISTLVPTRAGRLLASVVVGAVLSVGCIMAMLFHTVGVAFAEPILLAVIAIAGGLSTLACIAIVEARHPLPVAGFLDSSGGRGEATQQGEGSHRS
jgi:MFS family permease